MIVTAALYVAMSAFGAAMLMNMWVVARGHTLPDRILALDTMVINAISLLIIYGIAFDSMMYFEASMLFAMVGFISTVAYCRFLLRGNIIE